MKIKDLPVKYNSSSFSFLNSVSRFDAAFDETGNDQTDKLESDNDAANDADDDQIGLDLGLAGSIKEVHI